LRLAAIARLALDSSSESPSDRLLSLFSSIFPRPWTTSRSQLLSILRRSSTIESSPVCGVLRRNDFPIRDTLARTPTSRNNFCPYVKVDYSCLLLAEWNVRECRRRAALRLFPLYPENCYDSLTTVASVLFDSTWQFRKCARQNGASGSDESIDTEIRARSRSFPAATLNTSLPRCNSHRAFPISMRSLLVHSHVRKQRRRKMRGGKSRSAFHRHCSFDETDVTLVLSRISVAVTHRYV